MQRQQQKQQQQYAMQMEPMVAAYGSPNNVTSNLIQQYLDENKQLILAIMDNQTSGKLAECAENQARLQRNLMYLAAIADSQPQMPTISQFPPAQQMMPQSLMATRSPVMYGQSPHSGMHAQLGKGNGQDAVTTTMGVGASGGFPDLGGGGRDDGGAL